MRTHIFLAFLLSLFLHSATADTSCYPNDIPSPAVKRQTLILIDRTSYPDEIAKRDFLSAVRNIAARPDQRLVILSFAGIAPGESLARNLDVTIEGPITDEERINNTPIGPFKRSQACVRQRSALAVAKAGDVAEQLLNRADSAYARSEIAWALAQTLREFSNSPLPTHLLVFSDGIQNGSGQNFYTRKTPRRIDPETELKKTATNLGNLISQGSRMETTHLRAWWWGLLSAPPSDAPTRYADVDLLQRYEFYWNGILRFWNVSLEGIGLTLNNPRL